MNPEPGGLTIHIDDDRTSIVMNGGGRWTIPVGPMTLTANELEEADRPTPVQLTNALGVVHDHFDDVLIESPIVAAAPSIVFTGPHSRALAAVEAGTHDVLTEQVIERADVDDVFRTLVAESVEERRHNPGLAGDHVETIIATCCVVLAIVRRLDLHRITAMTTTPATNTEDR